MKDVSPKQGFAVIALMVGSMLTGYAVKPDTIPPHFSYERVDDSVVKIGINKTYDEYQSVPSLKRNIAILKQQEADALAKNPDFSTTDVEQDISEYENHLKGASAVGVTDADTALKDLGIQ